MSLNHAHGGVYSIQLNIIKFVSLRQVEGFLLMYSGLLHKKNWVPRYNWNIVESGVKHHNPITNTDCLQQVEDYARGHVWNVKTYNFNIQFDILNHFSFFQQINLFSKNDLGLDNSFKYLGFEPTWWNVLWALNLISMDRKLFYLQHCN